MSYCFKQGEPVAQAVRRIVQEEIDSAIRAMQSSSDRGEAIHEARKSMKKVRAVLRLARRGMRRKCKRENVFFRNLGRKLSAVRDADALVALAGRLEQRYDAAALAPVRAALLDLQRERREALQLQVDRFVRRLRRARARVAAWPPDRDGFGLIAPGLKRSYKLGRKAVRAAISSGDAGDFHEWRKRSKDLWYHVRLLEPAAPAALRSSKRALDEMQESLGDDHNLTVLEQCVKDDSTRFGGASVLHYLDSIIASERFRLRRKASRLAACVYRQRPRDFVAVIETIWEEWGAPARRTAGAAPAASRKTLRAG